MVVVGIIIIIITHLLSLAANLLYKELWREHGACERLGLHPKCALRVGHHLITLFDIVVHIVHIDRITKC